MQTKVGCRHRLVVIGAYLLVVALIFFLPLSVLAHNTIRVIFSTDTIREGVREIFLQPNGLRERLVGEVYTSDWVRGMIEDRRDPFQFLTEEDRFGVAQLLFPDSWIVSQVEQAYEALLEWLQSDERIPKITIDFDALKQRLLAGGSRELAVILVSSWPSCNIEQEQAMQRSFQSDLPLPFEFCQPGEELAARLVDRLDQRFQDHIDQIPGDISILGELDESNSASNLMTIKRQLLRALFVMRVLRFVPLALMGMVMTVVIRSYYDVGRWWGIPLSIGALFGLSSLVVLRSILPGVIQEAGNGNRSGDLDPIPDLFTLFAEEIIGASAAHFFLLFLLAAGLFLSAWIIHKRTWPGKITSSQVEAAGGSDEKADPPPKDVDQAGGIPFPPPLKPFDPEDPSDRE